MRIMKTVFVVLVCLAAAAAAFSAGYASCLVLRPDDVARGDAQQAVVPAAEPDQQERATFGVFWEAWHLLEDNFLGDLPNLQKMSYGAIRGVLTELRDPHTILVEPPQRQLEKDEHRGSFGGIGVWIYQRETDRAFMLTPIENGPAALAGVREGDILVRVDTTLIDTMTMTRDDVATLIRGPVGSTVQVGVRREDSNEEVNIEITRAEYETPSVEWRMLELEGRASDVAYLRILHFTERTAGEMREAVAEARRRGARRLVLDLRDNPGGLLDASLDVASEFLGEGPIMFEQKRDGSEQAYQGKADGTVRDLPVAVLVNGGTASAAEIVAGALHDAGRATLIGERTYGKGSVQLVYDLSDGSSVHVTVAKWLTAGRKPIDGVGIEPDQTIEMTSEDRSQARDPQLNAAILNLTQ